MFVRANRAAAPLKNTPSPVNAQLFYGRVLALAGIVKRKQQTPIIIGKQKKKQQDHLQIPGYLKNNCLIPNNFFSQVFLFQ